MADKPKADPEEPPVNRAERRRRAKGKQRPSAPETRGSANPHAQGVSRDQQRLAKGRR